MLTNLEHLIMEYLRHWEVKEQDAFTMGRDIAKMVWLWLFRPEIDYSSLWELVELINDYEESREK